jgi:glucose-6-phosphate 1-dehydrogenase
MAEAAVLPNPLKEGLRLRRSPEPCAMVIFGASGDLTARKIVPALYYLFRERLLPPGFSIIGCAKTPFTHETFRDKMREAIKKYLNPTAEEDSFLESFHQGIYYITDDFGDQGAYDQLIRLLDQLDRERGTSANRLFYLATPPSFFPVIVKHLGAVGLAKPKNAGKSWTRVVIEKPFGRDLASARELNRIVTAVFDENQVYRIDHYLGKETVQNLFVFRFANGIFEPIWNRRYIDHVQITVAEELGVENRASYYEEAGLVRDMIQNHVMQLLSLVAMEAPPRFEANAVRNEKVKVVQSIRPMRAEQVPEMTVRGQYAAGWVAGKRVPGYPEEPNVSPQSTTETFAAMKLFIDNWRWADVPFYLRSGKRLTKRVSEISVQFRCAPHLLFERELTEGIEPNLLSLRIQPNEGISLKFSAKVPETTLQIRPVQMEFRYGDSFGSTPPTAYETLLLDCMLGDAMLFTRDDAVEAAWEVIDPILERWRTDGSQGLELYEAGTWGPAAADALTARDGRKWQRL